jgi:hypothetical protein
MASDIYSYECVIDNRKIHLSACDMPDAFCEYNFYYVDLEGGASQIDPEVALTIIDRIRRGEIEITYLGGCCSSGVTWGPNNVRLYYHDELEKFHRSLQDR